MLRNGISAYSLQNPSMGYFPQVQTYGLTTSCEGVRTAKRLPIAMLKLIPLTSSIWRLARFKSNWPMRFFLPLAPSDIQAERIHKRIAEHLVELGYVIAPHRIYQVIFHRKGQMTSETVGSPSSNGEIVLAIFKNDIGYFICTYSRGAVWGDPIVARYGQVESAIFFDEQTVNLNIPGWIDRGWLLSGVCDALFMLIGADCPKPRRFFSGMAAPNWTQKRKHIKEDWLF